MQRWALMLMLALHVQVKLATWPDSFNTVQVDDVVASPTANGNGFAILNNTIGNLRGRAMIIKSSDGLIAGNTLFNLMHFAMGRCTPILARLSR